MDAKLNTCPPMHKTPAEVANLDSFTWQTKTTQHQPQSGVGKKPTREPANPAGFLPRSKKRPARLIEGWVGQATQYKWGRGGSSPHVAGGSVPLWPAAANQAAPVWAAAG